MLEEIPLGRTCQRNRIFDWINDIPKSNIDGYLKSRFTKIGHHGYFHAWIAHMRMSKFIHFSFPKRKAIVEINVSNRLKNDF